MLSYHHKDNDMLLVYAISVLHVRGNDLSFVLRTRQRVVFYDNVSSYVYL